MTGKEKSIITTLIVMGCLLHAQNAYAYIGPAIAFVSYLFGPVVAVIAVIGMILYLPVKMLLKKYKKSKTNSEDSTTAEK